MLFESLPRPFKVIDLCEFQLRIHVDKASSSTSSVWHINSFKFNIYKQTFIRLEVEAF